MRRRCIPGCRVAARVTALGAAALLAAPALGVPGVLRAQGGEALPDRAESLLDGDPARCNGEIIREIAIYSSAPTVARTHALPVVGPVARSIHVTTRPDVVRAYLLLREGEPCTELARAESERVLRVQPFIADADILVQPFEDGVRLEVRTTDEASLVLGARVQSASPYMRALRLGNSNVGGAGIYVAGEWRDGRAHRDGGALSVTHYRFLGQPYELHLHGNRAPLGGEWRASLTRPFLSGLQRHGWRAGLGEFAAYTTLQHPDSVAHAVRVERQYADAGIMGRVGPPTRMGLFGVVLSHEREHVGGELHAVGEEGALAPAGAHAAPPPYRSTRLNALVGLRSLAFVRVHGFDALTATQDIPVGLQAGVMVGRGLEPLADGQGRELFVAGDVYMGRGDSTQATRVQLRAQGVRPSSGGEWARAVVTGRIAHQRKPAARHLLELSADWAAAWRVGLPLQLMLGAEEGGVRGYEDARTGGARRARVTIEERYTVGDVGGLGDLGLAVFADAGRVWRSQSPFDVTTPLRRSVGLSILAAVPSRSARVWRLDLALPLDGPAARRLEIGLSRGDRTTVFWREPADVAALRGRSIPSSVFAWP